MAIADLASLIKLSAAIDARQRSALPATGSVARRCSSVSVKVGPDNTCGGVVGAQAAFGVGEGLFDQGDGVMIKSQLARV